MRDRSARCLSFEEKLSNVRIFPRVRSGTWSPITVSNRARWSAVSVTGHRFRACDVFSKRFENARFRVLLTSAKRPVFSLETSGRRMGNNGMHPCAPDQPLALQISAAPSERSRRARGMNRSDLWSSVFAKRLLDRARADWRSGSRGSRLMWL